MQKVFYLLVSIVILLVVFRLTIGFLSANRVATGLTISDGRNPSLSGCDGLQNCTSSTASSKENQTESIDYPSDARDVIDKIAGIIASQSGTSIVTQSPTYLHAAYKTTLMGYTDDLELLLNETDGVLHIRSASRMGKSDLGKNRKRIDALRLSLQGKI